MDRVSSRLALTRAKPDLHPERPDGVFLFVGPTGVGKTALARAIAQEVTGGEESLIRLDMSEYAHDWALARLIGPQPGFIGYNEPEGWLTTRVIAAPKSVILLDEIEKAHTTIWNAFLQVFDAGRLTDARCNVARFSDTVIVMTSNIGSEQYAKKSGPLGFSTDTGHEAGLREAVVDTVKRTMAPELVNRFDEIIVFEPLGEQVIREIAHAELEALSLRLSSRRFEIVVDDEIIDLVALTGYDKRYDETFTEKSRADDT